MSFVFYAKFMSYVTNWIELLKLEGNWYKYLHKWTKISINVGIWLDKNQDNFQTSENIAKNQEGVKFGFKGSSIKREQHIGNSKQTC